jgi:hypothetical protein
MKKIISFLSALGVLVPAFAFAQSASTGAFGILAVISRLLAYLIPLAITVAFLYFLYGVIKFIMAGGEEKAEARGVMINGIIGLFVIVSVWGLVKVITNTFGIDKKTSVGDQIPCVFNNPNAADFTHPCGY